jgi:uncharacterized protein YegL
MMLLILLCWIPGIGKIFGALMIMFYIFSLFPSLAVLVKRCHDFEVSGWLMLIPGFVIVVPFWPGSQGTNKYGPPCKVNFGTKQPSFNQPQTASSATSTTQIPTPPVQTQTPPAGNQENTGGDNSQGSGGYEDIRLVENPEPRCACVLLLDVSGSMAGEPIGSLNEGITTFRNELVLDNLASKRVEVAVVTFGNGVKVAQDFVTVDKFQPPRLSASGETPMGGAINTALDMIENRKKAYRTNGISYYMPWVFMITDGQPTDMWEQAAKRLQSDVNGKHVTFFAVGVAGANMNVLRQISPRPPVSLQGLRFRDMFIWLSSSMSSIAKSRPGDQVELESILGWATP